MRRLDREHRKQRRRGSLAILRIWNQLRFEWRERRDYRWQLGVRWELRVQQRR
jgi:hypothetical protein